MNTSQNKFHFNLYHMVLVAIFLMAFTIRIFGASTINIINAEAEALLSAANMNHAVSDSFFNSVILKVLFFLGIKGKFIIRLINSLIGSMVVLLPVLFTKEIGKRTTIVTALFYTFDPFNIANSIIFTGNFLTIFLVGLIIESFVHRRKNLFILLIVIFAIHGRGFGQLLAISFLFFMYLWIFRRADLSEVHFGIKRELFSKKNLPLVFLIVIMVLILSIVSSIPLSNMTSDIIRYFTGWINFYQTGNYPIIYPFALFSYIPLAIIATLLYLIQKPNMNNRINKKIIFWLAVVFLLIIFYPDHQLIDLIWISMPLWYIAALMVNNVLPENLNFRNSSLPFYAILFITGINLIMNLISLIYQNSWGMDNTKTIISILLMSVFIVVLILFQAYMSTSQKAVKIFILISFFYLGVFQISISSRAASFNHRPEEEILWNGYFPDQKIVNEIISSTKNNIFGTSGQLDIVYSGPINSSIIWALNNESLHILEGGIFSANTEVVVTSDGVEKINTGSYQGQEFIANSYPIWIWDPLRSFISSDYWNWLFFRNGQMFKEYNTIWINKTILEQHSQTGVK